METQPVNPAIQAMPKVELHCHLELAIRQETLKTFALERGYDVADDEKFAEAFLIQSPMGELPSVLHKFLNTRDVLDAADCIEQVTFEVCEDMYLHSNVRILELRYAPSFLLDKHTHISPDALQEAIQRGVARAESKYLMAVGLICILQRTKSVEDNANWVDFALNHKNGFLALDLADNEVDFDPEPFIPLFQRAKASGLGITVHAGEPRVVGISKNITTAIEAMGADRIGHGLQAIEDPRVIDLLVRTETRLSSARPVIGSPARAMGCMPTPSRNCSMPAYTRPSTPTIRASWLPTSTGNFSAFMSTVGLPQNSFGNALTGRGRTASSPGRKRCRGRHHERASLPQHPLDFVRSGVRRSGLRTSHRGNAESVIQCQSRLCALQPQRR